MPPRLLGLRRYVGREPFGVWFQLSGARCVTGDRSNTGETRFVKDVKDFA